MKTFSHDDLVKIAEKWLIKSRGCGFAFSELNTINYETPDSIGFRSGASILVEAKTSRADFHADKKKMPRRAPYTGMGSFRFYLCPEGIIKKDDLPEKWGLLWVNEKGRVRQKVGPRGNIWSSLNAAEFRFDDRNTQAETSMMYSALRRLHIRGVMGQIYDKPWDINNERVI